MCRRRRKGSIRTLVDVVCGSALAPNRPLVTGPLTLEESGGSKYLATRIEPGGSGARACGRDRWNRLLKSREREPRHIMRAYEGHYFRVSPMSIAHFETEGGNKRNEGTKG